MTEVSQIPERELTDVLYRRGKKKAELEREWVIADHSRHVILATLSAGFVGESLAGADRKARISGEYMAHIEKMGNIKGNLIMARAQYDAIAFEIKMRLSKQYEDRQEFRAGSIDT